MAQVAETPMMNPLIEPMLPRLMRVEKNRRETADSFTLEMVDPNGLPQPFEPGQFNMVGLIGVGEVPISVSGDPARPQVLVHTIRDVGAVTAALKRVQPGDMVAVRGPYGTPWPLDLAEDRDVIIVAGGIGLAPLRSVVYTILNHRTRYGKVAVLYGARTRKDILFAKELARWRSHFDLDFALTLDRGDGEWKGNVGVVTRLIPQTTIDPSNAIAFICGPEIMLRFTAQALTARGVSADRMYVSMERDMKCGIGLCGHCQLRGEFICRSGPVYPYSAVASLLSVREL